MTTGKTALTAVQTAVYGVLAADATLGTLAPGGVHDYVPDGTVMPYVRLGTAREEPEDAGLQGRRVTVVIDVWSQYRGLAEAYSITDRIIALLRYVELTLTGWTLDGVLHTGTFADAPELLEGVQVQHVTAEFEVVCTETPA